MQYQSRGLTRRHERGGIATIAIVVVLVVIVIVAGVGVFYLSTGGGSSTSSSSTSSLSTTTTTTSQTSTTTTSAQSTTSVTTSSAATGETTYTGEFNYTNPEGPGGERVFSNNTVQTYKSVQDAVGSFSFSINDTTYIGTGTGHGTMTVTTTGFCSGSVTLSYTFTVEVTHAPGENITIGFSTPTPVNATVPLACTGPMQGVDTATNNPVPFLSEYPGLITVPSIPATHSENLGYGITYYYSLIQTG